MVILSGRLYDTPRGSCGRKYVKQLNDEICYLARGSFPSEHILTFSAIVLQHDRMIKKSHDIVKTIDRRLDMWSSDRCDTLIQ